MRIFEALYNEEHPPTQQITRSEWHLDMRSIKSTMVKLHTNITHRSRRCNEIKVNSGAVLNQSGPVVPIEFGE